MRIVAVQDRLVRDPSTRRVVDADGLVIDPVDPHWARLLADGDVVEASEPKPEPEPASDAAEPAHEESAS